MEKRPPFPLYQKLEYLGTSPPHPLLAEMAGKRVEKYDNEYRRDDNIPYPPREIRFHMQVELRTYMGS